jgi:bifunctional non-homologous end joining protein LigD
VTPLEEYRAKRDFTHTPEPGGEAAARAAADGAAAVERRYVIQKHAATALHYDFRLELDGVLLSWAVPKGPSLDTHDKRLAVHVEDHPIPYADFEGTIPKGEYGGGTVIVWDTGTWTPVNDPHEGLAKGDLKFNLHGTKLNGIFVLVHMKPRPGEKREMWLLIKERDEFVRPHEEFDVIAEQPDSAVTGRSLEEVAAAGPPEVSAADTAKGAPAAAQSAIASAPAAAPAVPEAAIDAEIGLELATLVLRPPDSVGWLAEVKYDGYRAAFSLADGHARAFTRSHANWTDRFAPLARAVETLPVSSAVLDGEVVVFDDNGVSGFGLLQTALGSSPEKLSFVAFDLLHLNGRDLHELPLSTRKELLGTVLHDLPTGSPLRFADHVVDAADELYRQACSAGLEGVVCKRADSPYRAGRGRDWQKVKCRQTQELVVGGFTEGAGSRTGFGSLLVGAYDGDRLVYAGRVGTGFDDATLTELRGRLDGLERKDSPFDTLPHVTGHVLHWTEPTLVVEVAFREWTAEGHLRQPVFLGVREDKSPTEVTREVAEKDAPSDARADAGDTRSPAPQSAVDATPPSSAADGKAAKPIAVLGVRVTNPDKRLFPDSAFTKADFANYYAAIAPLMLAETADRPLTLVRCPVGHGRDCFYQRHPDKGLSEHIHTLDHTLKGETVKLLTIDSAEGLVALAQMGAVEVHTWLSRIDAPTRPDRIVFDLDPGEDVGWPQIRMTALLVAEECHALGFEPYLKSTGSKGLHVVLPIEPVWEFTRVRALAKALADRIAARHPGALTTLMAKSQRGGRVFFDYLRNAEGASAVAAYSTRKLTGPPCALPLAWDELTDDLDIRAFTPKRVLERAESGIDPWRELPRHTAGSVTLRAAEESLTGQTSLPD